MTEDLKNLVWMDDDHLADVFQESRMKQEVGILDNSVTRTDTVQRNSRNVSEHNDHTPSLSSDGSRRRESDITTTSEGSGFQ